MTTNDAFARRLARYAALVKDVRVTLGNEVGVAWLTAHREMTRKSIAAAEREWAATKKGLRHDGTDN